MRRSVDNAEVEVIYRIARKGLRWHGHIEYRKLAGRGRLFGTMWMEYRKRGMWDTRFPLCKAWKRGKLERLLCAEAEALGKVVKSEQVVSP